MFRFRGRGVHNKESVIAKDKRVVFKRLQILSTAFSCYVLGIHIVSHAEPSMNHVVVTVQ